MADINFETFFKISYGLYIVSSGDKKSGNGFISNTVFQVTSDPPKFAVCCNKNNYTAEFIQKYRAFAVSILTEDASPELFGKFGYQTGRNVEKMAGTTVSYGVTGVPAITESSAAILELKVVQTVDVGTHLIFIGLLVSSEILDAGAEPMTYDYYRKIRKGLSPKNAPTYIDKSKFEEISAGLIKHKYQCPACGYIYDENNEEMRFEDLPDNWICPVCGSEKSDFVKI